MERLGIIFAYDKQYAKAENLFQQALQAARYSSDKLLLANAWYDYACAAAVAGHRDQAFEYLQKGRPPISETETSPISPTMKT
jgi:tetratricopeptide (TPR) repeat protein